MRTIFASAAAAAQPAFRPRRGALPPPGWPR